MNEFQWADGSHSVSDIQDYVEYTIKKHEKIVLSINTFILNKSYAYLLNVEPSNLVFLKTYNTEFDVYYNINHHGAEISVTWLVERSAIKLLILIRY